MIKFIFLILSFTCASAQVVEDSDEIDEETLNFLKDPITDLDFIVKRVYIDSTKNIFYCKDELIDKFYHKTEIERFFLKEDIFIEKGYNLLRNNHITTKVFFAKHKIAVKVYIEKDSIYNLVVYKYDKDHYFTLKKIYFSKKTKIPHKEDITINLDNTGMVHLKLNQNGSIDKLVFANDSVSKLYLGYEIDFINNKFSEITINETKSIYCRTGFVKEFYDNEFLKSLKFFKFDFESKKGYRTGKWVKFANDGKIQETTRESRETELECSEIN